MFETPSIFHPRLSSSLFPRTSTNHRPSKHAQRRPTGSSARTANSLMEPLESRVLLSAAQIFVTNSITNSVGEYNLDGTTVKAALISSGLSGPWGIAVAGNDLFVVNNTAGTIGEYTTAGAVVNAALISGLNNPESIVISGADIFVANNGSGTVGEYTTSGAIVNANLVSGLPSGLGGIAVSGSDLYVASNTAQLGAGIVGEYLTTGGTVNASLILGLAGPTALAVSGSNLLVLNQNTGTIGEYALSNGATVQAPFISNLANTPEDFAVAGADMFLVNQTGSVGEYSTAGAAVNAALISTGLNDPLGIAVTSAPAAPSNVAATAASDTSVTVTWTLNDSSDTGVNLEQWNGTAWQTVATLAAGTTTDTVTGLVAGGTFEFDVVAVNNIGSTFATNYATVSTPQPVTPLAPSSVTATLLTASSVKLNWMLNSTNDTSVYVDQWNGTAWQVIAVLPAGSTTYTKTGISPGATYLFDVVAVNSQGSTFATSYATYLAQPAAPTALSSTVLSATSIKVQWTNNGGQTSIDLKSWNGSTWVDVTTLAANATSFTVTNLAPNTRYYFDVVAINSGGATWAANYTTAVTLAAIPPAAASNLSAARASGSSIQITWSLTGVVGETAVWVAKWNGTAWQMIAMLAAGTTQYLDTRAIAGTNLYEVVTSNAYGFSAYAIPYATAVL